MNQRIAKVIQVAKDYSWLMGLYFLSSCIQAFPMVSVAQVLNVEFQATASDVSFYYAIIFIPWNFRAIYGLISDSFPIFGYRRKIYIVPSYIIVASCYAVYGQVVSTLSQAFIVGVILNIFFSFSEAVLDAVSVEQIRLRNFGESEESRLRASCDIQSANMTFRTLGSLVSFLVAGGLSTHFSSRTIITATSIFPLISTLIYSVVPEPTSTEPTLVFTKSKHLLTYVSTCIRDRRWPLELVTTINPVLLPSFFILLYASCPSSNIMFVNYLYTSLPFTRVDFHLITQFGAIGGLIGTILYWKGFRNVKDFRWVFGLSVLVSVVAACSRLLIVHGLNSLGFVCADEVFVSVAMRLTLMPVQVYACIAASSKEHLMYEGFVFGLFASIENWGGTLSGIISGELSKHVTLDQMILICSGIALVPLLCLSLLDQTVEREEKNEKICGNSTDDPCDIP